MLDILKRDESIPSSYPTVPSGLSTAAAALDSDMIWARIESHIAYRWTARAVIWTIAGPGEWTPDLTPVTVSAVDVWENYAWATETLNASALGGYVLDGDGPYRITASVDSGTVPAPVNEAFRRLAEYLAEDAGMRGASSYSVSLGGAITQNYQRAPAWLARAMANSGAGDLLRPYRRA